MEELRLLLEQNNFMYDFYQTFRIIPIDEEVTFNKEDGTVAQNISDIISDIYQVNIALHNSLLDIGCNARCQFYQRNYQYQLC